MKAFRLAAAALSLIWVARGADLGDPAADLKIEKWVKGKPVELSGKGTYVVEFWATWCPPCRESIPHLTEMQKRFKEVTFVGVSDEKEGVVSPFVKKMGDKMDYRVAIDNDRKTSAGYMEAYGINGIPHAFVVQDKKVVWHGHPMGGLDEALAEITSGKFDLKKAKAKFRVEALYEQFREAAGEGKDAEADKLAAELKSAIAEGDSPLKNFDPAKEKREIRTQMLKQQFQATIFQGNEKQSEEIAAKIKQEDPKADIEGMRKEVATQKLAGEYLESTTAGKTASKEKGEELAEKLKGQARFGNQVAWHILTHPRITQRDHALALKIAKQACEDSEWKEADFIDTYARALFESGKKEEAVKAEEKAIGVADGEHKEQFEKTLASYKEGKLPSAE